MSHPLLSVSCLAAMLALASASAFAAGELARERPNQWRESKLSGVTIYGPENQKLGKISDILVSRDGKAEYVIIAVGGFLGIGQKDVAIPYDEVKFTDVPISPPMNPAPAPGNDMAATFPNLWADATTCTRVMSNGALATSGDCAASTAPGMGFQGNNATDGTGAPAMRSTAYPDHGTIDMTAAQLKAAPTFRFAS